MGTYFSGFHCHKEMKMINGHCHYKQLDGKCSLLFFWMYSVKKKKVTKCQLYDGKFMLSAESIFQSSRTMDK